ncbi:MAG: 4Fe-4S dicluster domain-containing protein [Coriobacteriales bacterium]|jgi:Fe-S-cluster-containing dehydrogenase component
MTEKSMTDGNSAASDSASASQYGMVIDTTVCVGCQTCVVSCIVAHELSEGVQWGHVLSLDGDVAYQPTGAFPNPRLAFRATLCNHCSNPACVAACPVGAMAKDPATGIVSVDQDECIGCGSCVEACPYEVPTLDPDTGKSSKCMLCASRVSAGQVPYCVESCPANARYFGDLADPGSQVSELVSAGAERWRPEEGTSPNVYYLM